MIPVNIILDILVLAALGWGAYNGYRSGLLSEVVTLLHFLIAFGLSFLIIRFLFNIIGSYFFNFNDIFPHLAFACTLGAAAAILSTAGKYLKTEIEYDFPGAWDNITGAIFGVLKYAVLLSFFFWLCTGLGSFNQTLVTDSITFKVIEPIAHTITGTKNSQDLSMFMRNALSNRR
jgi:membrane protein required for colicin V production